MDFMSLAKQVDDIDTDYAIQGRLTPDNIEKLHDILFDLQPYIQGRGTQDDVTDAFGVALAISKLLDKAGVEAPQRTAPGIDTTVCQLCGTEFTGSEEEIKAWEPIHLRQFHPENLNRP
jgi:hypothetical protein